MKNTQGDWAAELLKAYIIGIILTPWKASVRTGQLERATLEVLQFVD